MGRQRGAREPGGVRIIGGTWRGRKLRVVNAPGLRPSGDRARETLFNWLQPRIEGARCADLFAGTGVLGFEAASRGARQVTLVERSRPVSSVLNESVAMLKATQVEVVTAEALDWLKNCAPESLDIVFVDPPFGTDLAERTLAALSDSMVISPGALIYLESPSHRVPEIPPQFVPFKRERLGDVDIRLLQFESPA